MYNSKASLEIQMEFAGLLRSSGALLVHPDRVGDFDRLPWDPSGHFFFDLDLLWSDKQMHLRCQELLMRAVAEAPVEEFDTIVVPASTLGSIGPLPLAVSLAEKIESVSGMIILREAEFSRFEICPAALLSTEAALRGKRCLIVKDIVAGGWSVIQTVRELQKAAGKISGVLILVDLGMEDESGEWPDSLRKCKRHAIVTAKDLPSLLAN